jgi:hypothetical protein
MCQEEGFKFCLDTKNNQASPLDLASLSVWVFGHHLIFFHVLKMLSYITIFKKIEKSNICQFFIGSFMKTNGLLTFRSNYCIGSSKAIWWIHYLKVKLLIGYLKSFI